MTLDDVIGVEWFTGLHTIGFVAITSGYKDESGEWKMGWKCYVETATGINEKADTLYVAENGIKVPERIAKAVFPNIKLKWLK